MNAEQRRVGWIKLVKAGAPPCRMTETGGSADLFGQEAPNNFDGLRLVGALLVIVSHQFPLQGIEEPAWLGVTLGALGVSLFFGVSGYLVTGSWLADPEPTRFATRRLLRLWPGLATVVTILALAAIGHGGDHETAGWFFFRNLAFDRFDWAFFQRNPSVFLDGPLWTIPYEVGCYAGLAMAAFVLGRHVGWLAAAGLVLSAFVPTPLGLLAACFMMGVVLRTIGKAAWAVVCLALVVNSMVLPDRTLLLAMSAVAVCTGVRSWPLFRRAGRFGDFSYGAYLWAWPVAQVAVMLLGKTTAVAPMLAATLIYTFAIAWLSWHCIEKQALKLKPAKSR